MTQPVAVQNHLTIARFPSPSWGGERGGGQWSGFAKADTWDA
jgi:hypothetical protein